jgi:hypothetical protein
MPRKLHFGVSDALYTYPKGTLKTTHDVADFLEAKYQVIEHFTTDNEAAIRAMVKQQTERHARMVVAGRKPTLQPMFEEIKRSFKSYILKKRLDGRVAGVPTKASLRGVNHRLKRPYAKGNPVRPSFFDTGLYVSQFKVWVE